MLRIKRPFRFWKVLSSLAFIWFGLVQCHFNNGSPEEKYVSIRLNDSLKRYDSVEVVIIVAGDTSRVVGTVWAGPLAKPGSLADYRLSDAEERPLAIRVRAFDKSGQMVLNQILSKENGKQVVTTLPTLKPSLRLSSLIPSSGSLSPAFDSGHAAYVINLANNQKTIAFTAVSAYTYAIMKLGADILVSGTPSKSSSLQIGDNNFSIKVAAGSDSAVYSIKVVRGISIPIDTDTVPVTPRDSSLSGWKHSALVTVNTIAVNIGRGNTLLNIPVLIRLKSDFIKFSDVADSGADLRFARLDGTVLPHEITRWAPDDGKAEVWVKLDTVRGEDITVQFKMYWGNRSAQSTSDGSKVFSPNEGYSGVWHLSESATGTTGEFKEATGRYPGTAGFGDGKSLPKRVEGVVGYGQDFHPGKVGGTLSLPGNFDPGPQAWTFQGWFRVLGTSKGVIFTKGDQFLPDAQRFQINCLEGFGHQVALQRNGADFTSNIFLVESNWAYLSIVYDGVFANIYFDGFLREAKSWTQGTNGAGKAIFGANDILGDDESFDGSMDELMFSSQARSSEWIRFMYENQRTFSSLVTLKNLQ